MHLSRQYAALLSGILVLLVAIPLTLTLLQKPQDTRSRAAGGTSISLIPQPGPNNFIEKNVGDTVPVDVMVDPGSNLVTLIRMQVRYDPTKLQLTNNTPFTTNVAAFPQTLEGPIVNNGLLSIAISSGIDTTKAIRTVTKVGTLNFKAIEATNATPTTISFTGLTQAFSAGSNDQSAENVLTNASPATVTINAAVVTPTPQPGTPTPTHSPTPTLAPDQTALSFTVLLHGIGAAGDNPNPTGNSLSNKNPKHPQRNLIVSIYDSNDQLVTSKTGTLYYDGESGNFKGQVELGSNFATGTYTVKIKSDRYLRRQFPGVITITKSQNNILNITQLVAGDTNGDNTLNVLDYSALLDCGYGDLNPLPVTNSNSSFKQHVCQVHAPAINIDIDDNGIINSFDYNLFLRELSVQTGD